MDFEDDAADAMVTALTRAGVAPEQARIAAINMNQRAPTPTFVGLRQIHQGPVAPFPTKPQYQGSGCIGPTHHKIQRRAMGFHKESR